MMTAQNSLLGKLFANIYAFWLLLALPAIYLGVQRFVFHVNPDIFGQAGKISCWLLIATLLVTPLMLMLGPLPWLKARRRHLGVAAFLYGLLHTLVWLKDVHHLWDIVRSFVRPEAVTGWVALAMMVWPALTSTDAAVRRLGTRWKRIQRWVYPAAAILLLHWLLSVDFAWAPWIYSAPLIVLTLWRVARLQGRIGRV